jgi:SAM-dependent methyltransferase
MFSHVFAADISAAHLKAAQEAMRERGKANVSFLLSDDIASYESFPRFDVFFSIIVLQHNPPPLITHILRTLLQKLNPGGVAYFQVPTYHAAYRFKADEYLARELQFGVPEMHVLPQPHLFELLSELGCKMVESREDMVAGSGWLSNRLLVQKLQSKD